MSIEYAGFLNPGNKFHNFNKPCGWVGGGTWGNMVQNSMS